MKKEPVESEFEETKSNKPVETPIKRVIIIETDGNSVTIVKNELSLLEIREIGRQLQNIK